MTTAPDFMQSKGHSPAEVFNVEDRPKPRKAMSVIDALEAIEGFTNHNLTARMAKLEAAIRNCNGEACRAYGLSVGVTSDLLSAAYVLKRAAGQINVLLHAVGVMLLVPQILQRGEKIESV